MRKISAFILTVLLIFSLTSHMGQGAEPKQQRETKLTVSSNSETAIVAPMNTASQDETNTLSLQIRILSDENKNKL